MTRPRDVNVVSVDINEGHQLLALLKDYIDRLQKKAQEKRKPEFYSWENLESYKNRASKHSLT